MPTVTADETYTQTAQGAAVSDTRPSQTALRPMPDAAGAKLPTEVILGRYRVLSRCGRGGFGTVCTCWDTRLQRRVAIKRIPLMRNTDMRGISTSTVDEALAEARTACLLAHPNIVTVFDFEADGENAYLVMEYVDGLNLSELLARVEGGALTHEECAHMLASVGQALSYAHENGVLHLDIKPTNIMIDRQGTVKLADFGMATLASAAGYGGARGGTVGYMPPEQIEGMLVDERTDVFSLAVVTWQALTGKDPFAAASASESLTKIYHGAKPPLSKVDPSLAGAMENALTHAVVADATARTSSVDELVGEVLPGLGSTEEGADSLRRLVTQSEDDSPDETSWDVRHLPLRVRFPWVFQAFDRTVSAAATLWFCHLVLPAVSGGSTDLVVVGSLVCAIATAIWTPLGSALCGATLVWAIAVTNPTNASFPLAALLALALAAWWVSCGHVGRLSSASLLAPCCMPWPMASTAISAYALDPLPAFATASAGWLFGSFFSLAQDASFSANTIAYYFIALVKTPATWLLVLGCGASALVASAIALRGSVRAGVVGQVAGLSILVGAYVLAARVENGGIWLAPDLATVGVAVVLCMLMCILTALRGPLDGDQEGEEQDELS